MSVLPFEREQRAEEPVLSDADAKLRSEWMERIQEARKARAPYEPGWLMALAFAAGEQWQKWSRDERKLFLPELRDGEERYTADKIMQYRNTALGELTGDDDRPEIQLRRDDLPSEDYAATVNLAVEYGWDAEWRADDRLMDVKRVLVDLGTAAVRCRWDPTAGPIKVQVPHRNGQPILDLTEARAYVAGEQEAGRIVEFRDIREGRTCWDVLTPLHLLTPPAITDAEKFPWEVVVSPEAIDHLRDEYGAAAAGLVEDDDIASVFALASGGAVSSSDVDQQGQLRGHVWTYTCYLRPCRAYPKGQVVVLASNTFRLLHKRDELPYRGPDETYRPGLTYFHWWRVTGRFWGKSLVDGLKDPQRAINRRATQKNEIIDRGMPKAFVEEDALPHDPTGKPLEIIRMKKGSAKPEYDGGHGPGEWMYRDQDELRRDLEEAAGIRAVSLGENPASVTNFSQLALLRENDQTKLKPTIHSFRGGVARVLEDTVHDIRRYWGSEKFLALNGEEGIARTAVFDATKIPPFFLVKVAKGAPKPHSQAANLKMVEDIARYSVESSVPVPPQWLAESLKAGYPLPLPEPPGDDQSRLAQWENLQLIAGDQPQVGEFDDPLVHIPAVRSLQIQARMSGDAELEQRCEQHALEHLRIEELKAASAPPAEAPGAAAPDEPAA